jgi:hypothetical protein
MCSVFGLALPDASVCVEGPPSGNLHCVKHSCLVLLVVPRSAIRLLCNVIKNSLCYCLLITILDTRPSTSSSTSGFLQSVTCQMHSRLTATARLPLRLFSSGCSYLFCDFCGLFWVKFIPKCLNNRLIEQVKICSVTTGWANISFVIINQIHGVVRVVAFEFIIIVITLTQVIYNSIGYLKQTLFLGYVMLQLFGIYNLCYMSFALI